MRSRKREETGQTLPLIALLIAAGGLALMGIGRLGEAAVASARARTAADAAALAGAAEGKEAAVEMARANGARLVSFEAIGSDARVRVVLGGLVVTARATRVDFGGPAGSTHGLAAPLQAAIARASALLGAPVPIASGFRTHAQQAALWARRAHNPYPVAPPGRSMHERGLAIDVPRSFVPRLLRVARRSGLCQPYPNADPVHFELCH